MHFSKIYLQKNFVPNFAQDQFGREVIGIGITLNEGESLDEAKITAQQYISNYIHENKVESPHIVERNIGNNIPEIQINSKDEEKPLEQIIGECQTAEELKQWFYPSQSDPITAFAYKSKLKQLQP